jgi:signal peptide peptidase SppA
MPSHPPDPRRALPLDRPLAMEPRALEAFLRDGPRAARLGGDGSAKEAGYELSDGVAVVPVEGPLFDRGWSFLGLVDFEGYDTVAARVRAAMADREARAVVLQFDSPGGMVAGCADGARAIRAAADGAGKPLVAHADELCASAAYWLATAADRIVVPDTGTAGSVGVIAAFPDASARLEREGLRVHVITSGAAKADGHSAVPMSPEARARLQAEVDQLAGVFAADVARRRRMTADAVRALEARVFIGGEAVRAGLADDVGNLDAAVRIARSRADARRAAQAAAAARAAPPPPPTIPGWDATASQQFGVTPRQLSSGRAEARRRGLAWDRMTNMEKAALRSAEPGVFAALWAEREAEVNR